MGRKDVLTDLFDMVESGMELVEENEEMIRNITGQTNELNLRQSDMLREVNKTEDSIIVISETEEEFDSFSVLREGDKIAIQLDDKDIMVNAPEDCQLEKTEATLNNNVLEVKIPRENNDN